MKNVFLGFFFLFFSYFFSLIIFGKIVLPIHEHLTYWPIHYKIFSNFYREGSSAFDIFLAGNIKWYYFPQLFQPLSFLSVLIDIKYYTYFYDIIEKSLAFYSSFILSRKITKDIKFSSLIALFYSTIIHLKIIYILPGSVFCFAPYLFYLLLKNKKLTIKHYLIFFIAGISSSPVSEFSVVFIFLLAFLINEKKIIKNFYLSFTSLIIGMFLIMIPVIYSIYTVEMHRVDQIFSNESYEFSKITAANLASLFHLPKYLLYIAIFFVGIIFFNKKIMYIYLNFLIIFFIIIFSDKIKLLLSFFNSNFQSINFERIENIFPLFIILIMIFLREKNSKFKLLKYFKIISLISIFSIQVSIPSSQILSNFKKGLSNENYEMLNKIIFSNTNLISKVTSASKILIDTENYDKKINFFVTKNTFDGYYKFELYKKIKDTIGDARVASIGIDPMIAAMNGINVIDGYHNLYPKSYKIKFRKIIERELNLNQNNFDTWGNQVYLFFNDKNNLKIDFKSAKEIGANFIISSFEIKSDSLYLNRKFGNLYLYSIT
tara:strand:- start:454 stop:2088 length:1635 start_codon:yes stop_codon:yes gene_type:complete